MRNSAGHFWGSTPVVEVGGWEVLCSLFLVLSATLMGWNFTVSGGLIP